MFEYVKLTKKGFNLVIKRYLDKNAVHMTAFTPNGPNGYKTLLVSLFDFYLYIGFL